MMNTTTTNARTRTTTSLLLLLSSLLSTVNAKSFVSVHIPFALHNRSGEEHAIAEFGFNQHHSGSIAAYVYLLDSDLCGNKEGDINGTHHRYLYPKSDGPKKTPYMIMAKSGGCSAVTKARQAQRDGAAALIVAHQDCRCSDIACTEAYGATCVNETEEEEIMVNDGSAGDVSIPSLLLYKNVAESIMGELKKDQPVLMEFNWGLKEDCAMDELPTVQFNLWTTAHDPILDFETYRNFKTVATSMAPQAQFQPRFSLIPGERFHCDKQVDTGGPCDHLCTNHGRYCALHAAFLSGHAIVSETLRRLCIWKEYGVGAMENTEKAITTAYWDYILYHVEHCSEPHLYNNTDCIHDAFAAAKIDEDVLESCEADSGGLESDAINPLLENELTLQARSGVVALPALAIGHYVLEDASSWHLFEGLCRHFFTRNLTTTPDVCFQCAACANVIGCLENGGTCVDFQKPTEPPASKGDDGNDNKKKKKHHGWTWFWIIFICLAMGGGYYYYKKMQDNEGYDGNGRGGVLNSYFQLSGEDQ